MIELRPYQTAAIESLRDCFRSGIKRQVLVAPTGAGKSVICAQIISSAVSLGRKVLVVAHRKELIEQLSEKLDHAGVHDHGIIMADHERIRPGSPVQVASIQTLIRRDKPSADLVIIDECHHAVADSYASLFEHYSEAFFLGLTATPWRLGGQGLAELFEHVVVAETPAGLIEKGFLCNYVGFKYKSPSLDGIKTFNGDYEQGKLSLECSRSEIIGNVVTEWELHAKTLRTIVFAVNLEHAEALEKAFSARSIRSETVHCYMSKTQREAVMARVRSGETQVICNVGILGEGIDVPELDCCVLARPTKSLALYLQQVGRVMRPAPGKAFARVHDHAGCVDLHGLPDQERDYSLASSRATNSIKLKSLRTCENCFAVFTSRLDACPSCGVVNKKKTRAAIEEAAGEAVDIRTKTEPVNDPWRLDFIERLAVEALERGYRPGWFIHKYKSRYPTAPVPWNVFQRLKRMAR